MTATEASRPWPWRRLLAVVPVVVGWIVLVAVVDLGAGRMLGRGAPSAAPADLLLPGPEADLSPAAGEVDPRVDAPAYGGASWTADYWEQFHSVEYDEIPFLPGYLAEADFEFINISAGIRRSYQQAEAGPAAPVVWFFGGSTTWGEGQRDLHTVPSEVARLAEEMNVALRVVNYGQRGWSLWEEMLAFERALSTASAPDAVVFYDGVNDLNNQNPAVGGQPSDDPTAYDFGTELRDAVPPPFSTSASAVEVESSWSDPLVGDSLFLRLLERVTGWDTPAAAAGSDRIERIVERTLDIYERGQRMVVGLAESADTTPVFFWQPQFANRVTGQPPALVVERLPLSTIDITDAFAGYADEDVYIDGAHTNELGARLVARAMMPGLLVTLDVPPAGRSQP